MKRIAAVALILLMIALCSPALAAIAPYRTYTVGSDGSYVETQTAYEPGETYQKFGDKKLKQPEGLFYAANGHLYIADTGNKRVIEVTVRGELIAIYGAKKLDSPTGVFVDDQMRVYVADRTGKKVVVFSPSGEIIREYTRPDHPLYGQNNPFKPTKVVVDKRGNLYVLSEGNTNGVIQLAAADGDFLGYYGPNTTGVSVFTAIKQFLFDEDLLKDMNIIPVSLNHLAIDGKGLVYTVSDKVGDEIRRLNVAGRNTITPQKALRANNAVAVHDASGTIFTVNTSGEIMELCSDGSMMFRFNAYDAGEQRGGTFRTVSGLAVGEDYTLYILDKDNASLTALHPTRYADQIHEALQLFRDGRYAQAKEPWLEVLRMNSLFSYANIGIGNALYREGDFVGALKYYEIGGYKTGYSNAYWKIRSQWLNRYLGIFVIAVAAVAILCAALKAIDRRTRFLSPARQAVDRLWNIKILREMKDSLRLLRNPYDACYGIRREGKSSYLSAFIVLTLFFLCVVARKYFSGFLFNDTPEGAFELPMDAALIFGAFLLCSFSGYLVGNVMSGEARFRDLFAGLAYSLIPLVIFQPIVLLLTNVLTYNEGAFITLLNAVGYGWTAILIVTVVKYLNNFSFRRAFVMILWTLFTALIIAALVFVVYSFSVQLIDFVTTLYREVVYRFVL